MMGGGQGDRGGGEGEGDGGGDKESGRTCTNML